MSEATSFSVGVDNFLNYIRPYGRPETEFPVGLSVTASRRSQGETLHEWFVRLVDGYCAKNPELVAIEENIAAFGKCVWKRDTLSYASIPVLVAECPLDEYYLDASKQATYIRLDLNYDTLGEPFSHPLPHMHIGDDDAPRFSLDGGDAGNIIMDYLEFIFRHYAHSKWLSWAELTWMIDLDTLVPYDEATDPFSIIVTAFKENKFEVLDAHAENIARIKSALRRAKHSQCPDQMNRLHRLVLQYP